jgi:hypothetical protein
MAVVLVDGRHRLLRLPVRQLLLSDRAQVLPDGHGPQATDDEAARCGIRTSVTLTRTTADQPGCGGYSAHHGRVGL